MNKHIVLAIIVFSLILGMGQAAFAMILIDDFDGPNFIWVAYTTQTKTRTDTGLSGVVGGSRTVSYTFNTATTGVGQFSIWDGYLSLAIDAGDYGSFNILYDANGSGLGLDLSHENAIPVNFMTDHLGHLKPTVMSLTLTDNNSNSYTKDKTWSTYTSIPGFNDENFFLSDYTSINLSNIKSIRFSYESDDANDAEFNRIGMVPEPATCLLFGIGGILAALIRRRRRS